MGENQQQEMLDKIRERVFEREKELKKAGNEEDDLQATLQALEEITEVPREEMEHIAREIRKSYQLKELDKEMESLPALTEKISTEEFPASVRDALVQLPPLYRDEFLEEYQLRRHRSKTAYLLCLIPPPLSMQNLYNGRILLQILYTLTFGGFLVWWLRDLFLIPTMTRQYNRNLSRKVLEKTLRNLKRRTGKHRSPFQKIKDLVLDLVDDYRDRK